ncbi:type II toxin-antitoxin system VapB family antitoxin [Pseudomonas sp. FP597]
MTRCHKLLQISEGGALMRTISIIKDGDGQRIHLPADMAYDGVDELDISREGNTIILRPARPSWLSLADLPRADEGFLQEREEIIKGVRPE